MTDVEYPVEFLLERGGVVEARLLPAESMPGGRLQTAFMTRFDRIVRHGFLPNETTAGSVIEPARHLPKRAVLFDYIVSRAF